MHHSTVMTKRIPTHWRWLPIPVMGISLCIRKADQRPVHMLIWIWHVLHGMSETCQKFPGLVIGLHYLKFDDKHLNIPESPSTVRFVCLLDLLAIAAAARTWNLEHLRLELEITGFKSLTPDRCNISGLFWLQRCVVLFYYIVHGNVCLTKVGLTKREQEDVTESDLRMAVLWTLNVLFVWVWVWFIYSSTHEGRGNTVVLIVHALLATRFSIKVHPPLFSWACPSWYYLPVVMCAD